jgi:hypothetical protein
MRCFRGVVLALPWALLLQSWLEVLLLWMLWMLGRLYAHTAGLLHLLLLRLQPASRRGCPSFRTGCEVGGLELVELHEHRIVEIVVVVEHLPRFTTSHHLALTQAPCAVSSRRLLPTGRESK